jgi:glutamine amidotransferase
MFYLALTFGLAEDPLSAVQRMAGLVEQTAARYGVEAPLRMSIATTDGERLWAFRYASSGEDMPSLFYTADVTALRALFPGHPRLDGFSDASRLIVSEPLTQFAGVWKEVPRANCCLVEAGHIALKPFEPHP